MVLLRTSLLQEINLGDQAEPYTFNLRLWKQERGAMTSSLASARPVLSGPGDEIQSSAATGKHSASALPTCGTCPFPAVFLTSGLDFFGLYFSWLGFRQSWVLQ